MADSPVVARVRDLVEPIISDLGLDLYDIEQRGGTLRITVDTPPNSAAGVDLDQLALATRLISRDLDHHDPLPGSYTLEVTSPGVERQLRTPAHFQREVGKTITVRLSDVSADERRLEGVLVAADETTATIRVGADGSATERTIAIADVDRAKTVFEWGPQPKPGGKGAPKKSGQKSGHKSGQKSGQKKQKQSKTNTSQHNTSQHNTSKQNTSKQQPATSQAEPATEPATEPAAKKESS